MGVIRGQYWYRHEYGQITRHFFTFSIVYTLFVIKSNLGYHTRSVIHILKEFGMIESNYDVINRVEIP